MAQKSPESPISRRDFLKSMFLFGGAISTFYLEKIIINGFLEPEGSLPQRLGVFHSIMDRIKEFPDKSFPRRVLTSWLKLNAANLYAGAKDLYMAEKTSRHFLYGGGFELDISNHLSRSFMTYYPEIAFRHRDPLVGFGKWIVEMMDGHVEVNKSIPQKFCPKIPDRTQSVPTSVIFSSVWEAPPDYTDFYYSINHCSVTVSGTTSDCIDEKGQEAVRLSQASYSLHDRYVFEPTDSAGARPVNLAPYIKIFLGHMGVSNAHRFLSEHLDRESASTLLTTHYAITDEEASILQDAGYASDFDIRLPQVPLGRIILKT